MRVFFPLAAALLALAIVADFAAKSRSSDAALSVASASADARDSTLSRRLHVGRTFLVASYSLALLGVVSWVASAVRKERCRHVVLVVLLLVFLILQLVLV